MSLVFTNPQIQNITKDIILLPAVIHTADNSYDAQKASLLVTQDNLEKTDSDQKVFSDFWIETVSQYHAELLLLNSSVRTNYLNTDLVASGNKNGPHFPTSPIWTKFTPKLIDSNNGNPRSVSIALNESDYISKVSTTIADFKNGFTDGAYINTGVILGNEITLVTEVGLVVGQRLLVSGSSSMIVQIDTITPGGPPKLTFTVLVGTTFNGAVNIQNYFVGFNNSQRGGLSSVSPYDDLFAAYKTAINNHVSNWKINATAQKNILLVNGDLPPRKAQNTIALNSVITLLSTITSWESLTVVGVNGKYTDTGLSTVLSSVTSRTTFIASRTTEIDTFLGVVTQDGEGAFSGSGVYLDLFKTVDLRIAFASGTLFAVNQIALGVSVFDKKIQSGDNQLAQYNNTFALTRILADTTSGQINFEVASVVGFTVSDTVYVMDNSSIVYTRTIDQILGNFIKLNSNIPTVLSIGALSRIAKQK